MLLIPHQQKRKLPKTTERLPGRTQCPANTKLLKSITDILGPGGGGGLSACNTLKKYTGLCLLTIKWVMFPCGDRIMRLSVFPDWFLQAPVRLSSAHTRPGSGCRVSASSGVATSRAGRFSTPARRFRLGSRHNRTPPEPK